MKHVALAPLALAFVLGCSSSSSGGGFTSGDSGPGNNDAGTSSQSDGAAPGTDSGTPTPGTDAGMPPKADGGGPIDYTATCAAFAGAVCDKIQSCSTFAMSATFGDVATCKTRWAINCAATFKGQGTGATIAHTQACTAAFPSLVCEDVLHGKYGTDCAIPVGTLAIGAPCGDDAQCQSTFCARAEDNTCGQCAALSTLNGPCVNRACSAGFTCPDNKTTCDIPGSGQIGDGCGEQEDCDLAHAIGCNTSSMKCIQLTLAQAGGMCGVSSISATSYAVCPASGACSAVFNGTCSAAVADGAACSTGSTGPNCLPPAKCQNGKCTLPDPTACH